MALHVHKLHFTLHNNFKVSLEMEHDDAVSGQVIDYATLKHMPIT